MKTRLDSVREHRTTPCGPCEWAFSGFYWLWFRAPAPHPFLFLLINTHTLVQPVFFFSPFLPQTLPFSPLPILPSVYTYILSVSWVLDLLFTMCTSLSRQWRACLFFPLCDSDGFVYDKWVSVCNKENIFQETALLWYLKWESMNLSRGVFTQLIQWRRHQPC